MRDLRRAPAIAWFLWPLALWLASLACAFIGCVMHASADTNLGMLLLCFGAATVAVYGTPVSVLGAWLLGGQRAWVRRTVVVVAGLLAGPIGFSALRDTPPGVLVESLCKFSESSMKATGASIASLVHF